MKVLDRLGLLFNSNFAVGYLQLGWASM